MTECSKPENLISDMSEYMKQIEEDIQQLNQQIHQNQSFSQSNCQIEMPKKDEIKNDYINQQKAKLIDKVLMSQPDSNSFLKNNIMHHSQISENYSASGQEFSNYLSTSSILNKKFLNIQDQLNYDKDGGKYQKSNQESFSSLHQSQQDKPQEKRQNSLLDRAREQKMRNYEIKNPQPNEITEASHQIELKNVKNDQSPNIANCAKQNNIEHQLSVELLQSCGKEYQLTIKEESQSKEIDTIEKIRKLNGTSRCSIDDAITIQSSIGYEPLNPILTNQPLQSFNEHQFSNYDFQNNDLQIEQKSIQQHQDSMATIQNKYKRENNRQQLSKQIQELESEISTINNQFNNIQQNQNLSQKSEQKIENKDIQNLSLKYIDNQTIAMFEKQIKQLQFQKLQIMEDQYKDKKNFKELQQLLQQENDALRIQLQLVQKQNDKWKSENNANKESEHDLIQQLNSDLEKWRSRCKKSEDELKQEREKFSEAKRQMREIRDMLQDELEKSNKMMNDLQDKYERDQRLHKMQIKQLRKELLQERENANEMLKNVHKSQRKMNVFEVADKLKVERSFSNLSHRSLNQKTNNKPTQRSQMQRYKSSSTKKSQKKQTSKSKYLGYQIKVEDNNIKINDEKISKKKQVSNSNRQKINQNNQNKIIMNRKSPGQRQKISIEKNKKAEILKKELYEKKKISRSRSKSKINEQEMKKKQKEIIKASEQQEQDDLMQSLYKGPLQECVDISIQQSNHYVHPVNIKVHHSSQNQNLNFQKQDSLYKKIPSRNSANRSSNSKKRVTSNSSKNNNSLKQIKKLKNENLKEEDTQKQSIQQFKNEIVFKQESPLKTLLTPQSSIFDTSKKQFQLLNTQAEQEYHKLQNVQLKSKFQESSQSEREKIEFLKKKYGIKDNDIQNESRKAINEMNDLQIKLEQKGTAITQLKDSFGLTYEPFQFKDSASLLNTDDRSNILKLELQQSSLDQYLKLSSERYLNQ